MDSNRGRDRWARLRFAVVGPLLASPPPAGRLRAEFERLSQREWDHPSGQGPVRFAVSTIERWYYQARAADNDPVGALKRRPRADAGRVRATSPALIEALRDQYRAHPSWSAQLHWENLAVLVEADPALGPMPSYATLTRAMRNRGLVRKRRRRRFESAPVVQTREVLSWEVSRSHSLRRPLARRGEAQRHGSARGGGNRRQSHDLALRARSGLARERRRTRLAHTAGRSEIPHHAGAGRHDCRRTARRARGGRPGPRLRHLR